MEDKTNDKPLISYNDQGFVINYSVTRNEEIAFVDYENETITFKQMPLPLSRIREMISYFEKNKNDHDKYLAREKDNENSRSKDSK